MTNYYIGKVERSGDRLIQPQEGGVKFRVPYNTAKYDITLRDEELNAILKKGLNSLAESQNINPRTRLELTLPFAVFVPEEVATFYLGAAEVSASGIVKAREYKTAHMEINVVSSNCIDNYAGILTVDKPENYPWEYVRHVASPLPHMPHSV